MATTSAMADTDLGNGLSFGGELNAERDNDADTNKIKVTPELTFTRGDLELTLDTPLALYNNGSVVSDTLDVLPVLNFGASYDVTETLELYGTTSYDLEAETAGTVKVGVTFSF